jgi:hypothetical protein
MDHYGGLLAGICVSECLENKQQTTGVVWPGSIEVVELPQCGDSFSFLFFLFGGKLAATVWSPFSIALVVVGTFFLDPWSGHVNTDCGRSGR